ncbi:hypothetical protein SAMN05660649_01920 [Desulfotomaculum arcticum]|uniref:Uncharacterized protein n=1 Tax=Desulfotruncus arcticus DSM 17038 TaxID=1121424 RepID=A0A1I2SNC9_9FIRM|nr:hypothetical protein [Desulfotruncus arcticus]SFG54268.1 hypothetical protein SAMN05660649_01920 [Desulfotomaculum arcticum] [Desulfotruncus arcticus DSM 17038]
MSEKEIKFVPKPGTCVPWEVKKEELQKIHGNEEIVKKEWEKLDAFAYSFIWFWVQR